MYLSVTVYACLVSSVVCGQNTTIYRVAGNIQYIHSTTILDEYKVVRYSNFADEYFVYEGKPEQAKGVNGG